MAAPRGLRSTTANTHGPGSVWKYYMVPLQQKACWFSLGTCPLGSCPHRSGCLQLRDFSCTQHLVPNGSLGSPIPSSVRYLLQLYPSFLILYLQGCLPQVLVAAIDNPRSNPRVARAGRRREVELERWQELIKGWKKPEYRSHRLWSPEEFLRAFTSSGPRVSARGWQLHYWPMSRGKGSLGL